MTYIDIQLVSDIVRAASTHMDRTGGFEVHDKGARENIVTSSDLAVQHFLAHKVELTDPFIRQPYQIDNLIEFIQTVKQSVADPEGLEIHLSTANDDEHRPDVIDIFDAITDDLAPRGIDFTYDFNADHDRYIRLDNGWKINLGRGLDIFERVERFSIDRISQEDRRCKACSIAFVREEDEL